MEADATAEPQSHWLYTWLEINGIRNRRGAVSKLASPRSFRQLQDMAQAFRESKLDKASLPGASLLAARGLDFSGVLTCPNPECRKLEVDNLLQRVWHYFDSVVVDDIVTRPIANMSRNRAGEADFLQWFISTVDVFLYLKDIGAEDMLIHYEKLHTHTLPSSWRDILGDTGLGHLIPVAEDMIEKIISEGDVSVVRKYGALMLDIKHPMLTGVTRISKPRRSQDVSQDDLARICIEDIIGKHITQVYLDLATSGDLNVPLGSVLPTYEGLLTHLGRSASTQEVAFSLDLPFLSGISPIDIAKLREYERESFERFQASLRRGITEYIANTPNESAGNLANQIKMDLIEPELRKIRVSMSAAADIFAKKSTVAVGVSVLTTVVGAAAGLALGGLAAAAAISAGALAAGTAVNTAYAKRADTEAEMRASDMWFLWKALEHSEPSRQLR